MILVTGATGLTGSFVVDELARRGHRVCALSRGRAVANAEVVAGDLRDAASGPEGSRRLELRGAPLGTLVPRHRWR